MGGRRVDLGRVRPLQTQHVPCKRYRCELETKAETEERDPVLPRIIRGLYLSLRSASPVSLGENDAVRGVEGSELVAALELFRLYPSYLDLRPETRPRVEERLVDAHVAVSQRRIFPDERDIYHPL